MGLGYLVLHLSSTRVALQLPCRFINKFPLSISSLFCLGLLPQIHHDLACFGVDCVFYSPFAKAKSGTVLHSTNSQRSYTIERFFLLIYNRCSAFIAASRRKDRGLDARLGSANRASMLHRERTGKSLRISKDIVEKEAMYEEVDEWYREKRIRVLQVQSMRIEEQLNQQLLAALTVRASHRGSTSSSSSSAATTASPTSPASSASSVPPQPLACHYQPQQVASRTPQAPMDAMHKESLDIPSLPPSALDKMQTTELNRFTEPSYVMSPRYDSIASLQNKQDEWYSRRRLLMPSNVTGYNNGQDSSRSNSNNKLTLRKTISHRCQ